MGLDSQSCGFSSSHVQKWYLNHKDGWEPRNWCFQTVGLKKALESPLDCKEIQPVKKEINPEYSLEGLCQSWSSNTSATWCKELTHRKRPWCWKRLKAGEGDDRGCDVWMAAPTQWTWVSANSGRWWRTGKPGVLQSVGLQRVRHNWVTKQPPPPRWGSLSKHSPDLRAKVLPPPLN